MSLLGKALKSTALVTLSNYITLVTSFLGFLLIVLVISPEEYGSYVLVLSFVYAATGLIGFGAGPLVVSELTQKLETGDMEFVKSFLFSHIKVNVSLGVLSLVIFAISPALFPQELGGISGLMAIGGVMVLSEVIKRTVSQIFLIRTKFLENSVLITLNAIIRLVFLVVLTYFFGLGAFGGIASFVIAGFVAPLLLSRGVINFINEIRNVKGTQKGIYSTLMLKRGKYLTISSQLKSVGDQLPIWAVAYYFGTTELALFSVARRLMNPVILFLKSLESVSLPLINQGITKSREQGSRIYFAFSKLGLYAAIILGLSAYLLVPALIELVFPGEYIDSLPLFNLMLPLLVLTGLGTSQRSLINSLRMQKTFVVDYSASVLLFLISFILLVPHLGLAGVAISVVVSRLIVLIREYRIIHILGKQNLADIIIPTKEDIALFKRAKKMIFVKLATGRNKLLKN